MIREAKTGDMPAFIALVTRFREQLATYPNCPVDRASVVQTFGRCVSSAQHLALVSERDGEMVGALLAITQELWWSKAKEATDAMIFGSQGDGYRMARRYIRWAWRRPHVEIVTLAHSSGGDLRQVERLHKVLGMTTIGIIGQMVKPEVELEVAA